MESTLPPRRADYRALITALRAPAGAESPAGDRCASLHIYEGQYLLELHQGARQTFKLLTPAAVAEAFSGRTQDSGWLPPGVVRAGDSLKGPFVVAFRPPSRQALLVQHTSATRPRRLTVPLPGLVLAGQATQWWIWAVKESAFTPTARLHATPLPNVFEDGAICWGANGPPAATAANVAAVWDLFFASPFNDHLAQRRVQGHGDVRPFLRELAGQKTGSFPPDLLIPYAAGATVAVACERFVRSL